MEGDAAVTSEIKNITGSAVSSAGSEAEATMEEVVKNVTNTEQITGSASEALEASSAQKPPGTGVDTGGPGETGPQADPIKSKPVDAPSDDIIDESNPTELAEDTSEQGMKDSLKEVEKELENPEKLSIEEKKKLNERRDKLKEGIKEHKELNRSDLSKWMRGKGKSGLNMTEDLVKEGGGFKMKNVLKVMGMVMLGGYFLVARQMQSEGECKKQCKARNNPKGTCSDPNIPEANCPKKETDCDTYCANACSQENRIARAQKQVADDPTGAVLGAMAGALNSPFEFWDTFKYVIMGIGTILILVLVYKFSTAWVSGKAANMTIRGTTRGLGSTDLQKYNDSMKTIKQVNG
jgi:hypothetical protein